METDYFFSQCHWARFFLAKITARNFFSNKTQAPPPPRISNGPCLMQNRPTYSTEPGDEIRSVYIFVLYIHQNLERRFVPSTYSPHILTRTRREDSFRLHIRPIYSQEPGEKIRSVYIFVPYTHKNLERRFVPSTYSSHILTRTWREDSSRLHIRPIYSLHLQSQGRTAAVYLQRLDIQTERNNYTVSPTTKDNVICL